MVRVELNFYPDFVPRQLIIQIMIKNIAASGLHSSLPKNVIQYIHFGIYTPYLLNSPTVYDTKALDNPLAVAP